MPSRSRSRSYSRGRPAKRGRRRSSSIGSGMYAAAVGSPARAYARVNRVRAQGVHTFSRYCAPQTVEMNGTYLSRGYDLKFEDMIQSSDFTGLFDSYRIVKCTISFQLINVPEATLYVNGAGSTTIASQTNWYPKIWYIPDYDGGPDETLNSIRERQGVKCRILQPNRTVSVSYVPKCQVLTYEIGETVGKAPKNLKIDMAHTAVPHYGLRCVFDTNGIDPNDTYPFKIAVERKLTFKCYGVR